MTFRLDTETLSLDRLDPKHEHRLLLDPDAWTREQRATDQPIDAIDMVAADFRYDTSKDSINYNRDTRGPTSITIHWWGEPAHHRSGQPEGVLAWLTGITGNRGSSAHYVATVNTASREPVVYQIIADADAAWHAGHTDANWNSIGIEMMPWDTATPVWQQAALLELAAELVASLWHRWPNLRTVPLKGHRDWMSTECPGSYYPRLGSIYSRAQQLYGMYAGSFGQFNKTGGVPPAINQEVFDVTPEDIKKIAAAVLDTPIPRKGLPKGHPNAGTNTTLRAVIAWSDANLEKGWPEQLLDTRVTRKGQTSGAGQQVTVRTLFEHLDHMADRPDQQLRDAVAQVRAHLDAGDTRSARLALAALEDGAES